MIGTLVLKNDAKQGSQKQRGQRTARLFYIDTRGQNGKLNQGQKTVEKRTGATEISQNFTLKNGKWTSMYLIKRLYDENHKTTLVATFEWSAKAKK